MEEWVCDICGKEAGLHRCIHGKHEYFCWDCAWAKKIGTTHDLRDGNELMKERE